MRPFEILGICPTLSLEEIDNHLEALGGYDKSHLDVQTAYDELFDDVSRLKYFFKELPQEMEAEFIEKWHADVAQALKPPVVKIDGCADVFYPNPLFLDETWDEQPDSEAQANALALRQEAYDYKMAIWAEWKEDARHAEHWLRVYEALCEKRHKKVVLLQDYRRLQAAVNAGENDTIKDLLVNVKLFKMLSLKPTLNVDDINLAYQKMAQLRPNSLGYQEKIKIARDVLSNEVIRLFYYIARHDEYRFHDDAIVTMWINTENLYWIETYIAVQKSFFERRIGWKMLSLLQMAIQLGKANVVACILNLVPNIDLNHADDKYTDSLLTLAVKSGQISILLLLFRHGAKIAPQDGALYEAITQKQNLMAHYLLAKGAVANGMVLPRKNESKIGHTFLSCALIDGNIALAEALINSGACVETAIGKIAFELNHQLTVLMFNGAVNKTDVTAAQQAQKAKYLSLLQFLFTYAVGKKLHSNNFDWRNVFRGADVTGWSFVAMSYRGHPITKDQLEAWGCINTYHAILTQDDILTKCPEKMQVQLLTQLDKIPHAPYWSQCICAVTLVEAVENDNALMTLFRLKQNDDPNQMMGNDSLLVWAAKKNYEGVAAMLAQSPLIDKAEVTKAVKAARSARHQGLAKAIFEYQDVAQIDEDGDTLLHLAVYAGLADDVVQLITMGANPFTKNNRGQSPFEVAETREESLIVQLLKDAMTKSSIKIGSSPDAFFGLNNATDGANSKVNRL